MSQTFISSHLHSKCVDQTKIQPLKNRLDSLFAHRHPACVSTRKRPIAGDGSLHPDEVGFKRYINNIVNFDEYSLICVHVKD
jgi:hypothetical protein